MKPYLANALQPLGRPVISNAPGSPGVERRGQEPRGSKTRELNHLKELTYISTCWGWSETDIKDLIQTAFEHPRLSSCPIGTSKRSNACWYYGTQIHGIEEQVSQFNMDVKTYHAQPAGRLQEK